MVNDNVMGDVVVVFCKKIIDGNLYEFNFYMFDKVMFFFYFSKLVIIFDDEILYVVDMKIDELLDGIWVVEIEGKISIKELICIFVGRVFVVLIFGG